MMGVKIFRMPSLEELSSSKPVELKMLVRKLRSSRKFYLVGCGIGACFTMLNLLKENVDILDVMPCALMLIAGLGAILNTNSQIKQIRLIQHQQEEEQGET
jgi:hypothetical protein